MATTTIDYLGQGPQALQSDTVSNVFPGQNVTDPKRNIVDFQAEEAETVTVNAQDVQDQFFQKALKKEVDVNSMFENNNKIPLSIIEAATEAYSIINSPNTSNAPLPNLQTLNQSIATFKNQYDRSVPTSEKLSQGLSQTGAFPINLATGEVMTPPSVSGLPDQNSFAASLIPNVKTVLDKKSRQEARFMEWSSSKVEAPTDPRILKAIARRVDPTMGGNLARRTYETLGFFNEGIGFYLPRIMSGAVNKLQAGVDVFGFDVSLFGEPDPNRAVPGEPNSQSWFDKDMQKELNEFRNSDTFFSALPNTDRHRIVNELIRDDIRKTMSPEEFEAQGYNEKINVDGTEVYKKNFVTPKFASEVFEFAMDEGGFFEQVAVFIAEGGVAYKALTAPFVIGKRIGDGSNLVQRVLHKQRFGKNSNVPFKVGGIEEKVARSRNYALTHNISITEAARELALKNTSNSRLAKFSADRIANNVNKRFNYNTVKTGMQGIQTKIDEKGSLLVEARISGNKEYAKKLEDELYTLKNNRNYQMFKLAGANSINYGLNPRQDLKISMVQAAGRNFWANDQRDGSMGEGLAVGGMLLFGGLKKFYNYQTGLKLPIIDNFVENTAFKTKIGIENLANVLLLGYGKGMLINPDLRSLNNAKDQLQLSVAGIRQIDEFTKNALNLPKVQSDMLVKNLMDSVQDIHVMTRDIPDEFRKGIQNKLVLSLADSSGISVFYGLANDMKLKELGFKKRDIRLFNKNVQRSISSQNFGEERIKNFTAVADGLKADILKMENSGKVQPEVMLRLTNMANQYQAISVRQQQMFSANIATEITEIDHFLKELSQPVNEQLLKMWTSGNDIETPLGKLLDLRNKAESYLLRTTPTRSDAQQVIETQRLSIGTVAKNLVTSIVESNKRLQLTSTQANAINESNKTIASLAQIIRQTSDYKIQTEYNKIDPSVSIDFVNTGDNILTMFAEFAEGYGLKGAANIVNRNTSPLLGSAHGRQLLEGLEDGAKRGLMKVFDDQDIIDIMNSQLSKDDTPFASGDDLLKYFKDEAQANASTRIKFGISENENMSNFQMLKYMVENDNVPFDANDFGFLASPLEFEKLRQSFQVFSKSDVPIHKSLGIRMMNLLDQDFKSWGNSANVEQYNNVIRARKVARLEKQRFDKNTIGNQIEQASAGSTIKYLGIEGQETTITKSNINKVFDPFIAAIVNPTDRTASFVKGEMKRFISSFASTTENLPEQVLIKGPDGKFIEPTDTQVNNMVTPVFDLTTDDGAAGFAALNQTLQSLLYSRFISTKGLTNVANQIKKGEKPDLSKMTLGNLQVKDNTGINIPKKVPLPTQFANYEEYIDAIEELIKVDVRYVDKETGELVTESMPAFDVREMLKSEQGVTDAIMASKDFNKTHAEFVTLVQKENEISQTSTIKLFQQEQAEVYKQSRLYKDSMTGDAFFNDVIMRGDPNSVNIYIDDLNRLVDEGQMTLDQSQKVLQSLVIDVLRASGGESKNGNTFKFYNGQVIPVSSYETPEIPFAMLTAFDDVSEKGVRTALSFQAEKFNKLMDAAGVTDEQKELLVAMYRHSTKTDAQAVLSRAGMGAGAKLTGPSPGFTLNNTLSKAFNIARGMVSKEYVMAEMAIRYAALAEGAVLNTILNDERVTNTILNLMKDPTRVLEEDADYFVKAIIKFSANALKNTINLNHDSHYQEENYWKSKGVVYPQQKKNN